MTLEPRAVLVHRTSEYTELLNRHATHQMAKFYLASRGRDIAALQRRHDQQTQDLERLATAVPRHWRQTTVERADLDRFLFGPEDIIVVLGQDGLVANVAKYVEDQPVIGFCPSDAASPGVLTKQPIDQATELVLSVAARRVQLEARTMVVAKTDDGQQLRALNEVYIGHGGHQSSRYLLRVGDDQAERQSSSGIICGTGTGATGWLASLCHDRGGQVSLPRPLEPKLAWFAREAWPSHFTSVDHTHGSVGMADRLELVVESEELVCFGDGMEADALKLRWGQTVGVEIAQQKLNLLG